MNIFAVDDDPQTAARGLCDKHVVKMVLESSQLLCTAHHETGSDLPRPDYFLKATHRNHPCAVWTREAAGNYLWLARHNLELCAEYTFRYGRVHKCERERLAEWLALNMPPGIPLKGRMPFRQAMPEEFRCADSVEAYKAYYLGAKRRLLAWTRREPPIWVPREWLAQNGEKWLIFAPLA